MRVEAAVAGRSRAGTAEHTIDLDVPPATPFPLRAVVAAVVRAEVAAFRQRAEERSFVRVLTERALNDGVRLGAVRSGGSEAPADVDVDEAVALAP